MSIKLRNNMSQIMDGSPVQPKASLPLKVVAVDLAEEEYSRNSQYDFNETSSFHMGTNTNHTVRESTVSELKSPVSALPVNQASVSGVLASPTINLIAANRGSLNSKIQI